MKNDKQFFQGVNHKGKHMLGLLYHYLQLFLKTIRPTAPLNVSQK